MEIKEETIRHALVGITALLVGGGAGFKGADVQQAGHSQEVNELRLEVERIRFELRRTNDRLQWLTTGDVDFGFMAAPAAAMPALEAIIDLEPEEVENTTVEE